MPVLEFEICILESVRLRWEIFHFVRANSGWRKFLKIIVFQEANRKSLEWLRISLAEVWPPHLL